MPKRQRKFADDSWAVWVDGDDISTIYLNDWMNPKGDSYVDFAIRICGVKESRALSVYVPFDILREEIHDISLNFGNMRILHAIFSATCIVDYKKNQHTSEIAYNSKTIDIVHISTLDYSVEKLSKGTLIRVDLQSLQPFLDNDEAYFIWRMPHKTLNTMFQQNSEVGNRLKRLKLVVTTPIISEKYSYSVRINESRLLPEEITRIGAFHRQKLKKAVITLSVDKGYELNDSGCYRIRPLEEDLYQEFLPENYDSEDVITYHWVQSRENNLRGQFTFYYSITQDSISSASMSLYLFLLLVFGVAGNLLADVARFFINKLF